MTDHPDHQPTPPEDPAALEAAERHAPRRLALLMLGFVALGLLLPQPAIDRLTGLLPTRQESAEAVFTDRIAAFDAALQSGQRPPQATDAALATALPDLQLRRLLRLGPATADQLTRARARLRTLNASITPTTSPAARRALRAAHARKLTAEILTRHQPDAVAEALVALDGQVSAGRQVVNGQVVIDK